ncbi:hypothetical protein BCB68_00975 [Leptotrichia sp. oral taxon 498]|uniref:hypothetical protein n=1 Tax=Leptotrichia sp. oral taxon 498 TaxID=712368 RepID=UPI000B8C9D5D|nr:hypothetical protein [Leptotrichia sp. oral taxon 498]ASQ47665.1 hypothetical protein BCB68_00975 [Leptotrichia sp. oral taxon 498]
MKKLFLGIFLVIGILSFGKQRITVKSKSYCTDYLGAAGYDNESITGDGTPGEYYMFKKCVINGRTYYGDDATDSDKEYHRAALRIYYNSDLQKEYFSELIDNAERVYIKTGVTIEDEGGGNFGVNVKKIIVK